VSASITCCAPVLQYQQISTGPAQRLIQNTPSFIPANLQSDPAADRLLERT